MDYFASIPEHVNAGNDSSLNVHTRRSLFSLCLDEQYVRRVDSGPRIKAYLAALKSNDYRSGSGFLLLLLLICLSGLSAKVIIARHVRCAGASARARASNANEGDNKPLAVVLFVIKTGETP